MKSIVLTTALALGLAAPALAASQLEQTLGVPAGVYSTNELAEMFTARDLDSVNERRVILDSRSEDSTSSVSSRSGHNARAREIFANIRAESRGDE